MTAKKRITQDTFDEAVRENMDDFDMPREEAIKDAMEQFEMQVRNMHQLACPAPLNATLLAAH